MDPLVGGGELRRSPLTFRRRPEKKPTPALSHYRWRVSITSPLLTFDKFQLSKFVTIYIVQMSSYRNFVFTSYVDTIYIDTSNIIYYVYQREKCPETGRLHYQGYVELDKRRNLNSLKKNVFKDNTIHIERRMGTQQQAIDYCKKSESRYSDPVEFGTPRCQGKRTDLKTAIEIIQSGGKIIDVVDEVPSVIVRYSKGIKELKFHLDKRATSKYRDVNTTVLWGPAGVGKTRYVYDKFDDVYKLDSANNLWFDGYDSEKTLLIDDFYGWIKYGMLLNMLDVYPLRLEIKGSFTWAQWSKVFITSNVHPESWYSVHGMSDALKRRIHEIIHME